MLRCHFDLFRRLRNCHCGLDLAHLLARLLGQVCKYLWLLLIASLFFASVCCWTKTSLSPFSDCSSCYDGVWDLAFSQYYSAVTSEMRFQPECCVDARTGGFAHSCNLTLTLATSAVVSKLLSSGSAACLNTNTFVCVWNSVSCFVFAWICLELVDLLIGYFS